MYNTGKLSALAAIGLVAGAMGSVDAASTTPTQCVAPTAMQVQALMQQLDGSHKAMFNLLDCTAQNLAIQMANQTCKGKNSCKGLNACKTDSNDCAGAGGCKGTGKGPFMDKNVAVNVAAMRMLEKRAAATS